LVAIRKGAGLGILVGQEVPHDLSPKAGIDAAAVGGGYAEKRGAKGSDRKDDEGQEHD
jgi:hypothetical protein